MQVDYLISIRRHSRLPRLDRGVPLAQEAPGARLDRGVPLAQEAPSTRVDRAPFPVYLLHQNRNLVLVFEYPCHHLSRH